jgi:endoglucanase Acf2
VHGFLGSACVNTYRGANTPQGTLTSPTFTIQKHFIQLLVGGGNDTNNDAVRLLIGTNVVFAAAGQQSGTLYWNTWDVSAYLGQAAQIEIVDTTSAGWGFVLCSWIVASDDGSSPAARYSGSFSPVQSVVTGWSDWVMQFSLPDATGRHVDLTLARGVPFVWTAWTGANPVINFGAGPLYDTNGNAITFVGGTNFTAPAFSFDDQGRSFGVFAPDNTTFTVSGSTVTALLPGTNNYLVLGVLPAHTNLNEFARYAYAQVTDTRFDWVYDPAAGQVETTWTLTTTPLKGAQTNTIEGWLPHHYRTTSNNLAFKPLPDTTIGGP